MFIEIEQRYLPQIDKLIAKHLPNKTLTQEEILNLFQKYKKGDQYSRDLIVYSQLKLVYLYTKKFHATLNGALISEEDLLGFANLILMEILETYDPFTKKEEGAFNNFSSYVRTWLEYNLHTELKKYGLLIKLPSNKITEIAAQKRYILKYEQKYGEKPRHGDEVIFCEKGETRKVVFDIANEKMHIYTKQSQAFSLLKSIKYEEELFEVTSGNDLVMMEGTNSQIEFFDTVEAQEEYSNPNDKIIKKAIETAIADLSEREKEYVSLFYLKEQPLKNIPILLKPDLQNKNEIKTLNKTSENRISVSIGKKDGSKIFIEYKVVANHHVEEQVSDEITSKEITCFSHNYSNFSTKSLSDKYSFTFEDIDSVNIKNIEIIHHKHKKSSNICFNISKTSDGKFELSFEIQYSYGMIFTPQTFLNNNENLLKKLRTKLINIKPLTLS